MVAFAPTAPPPGSGTSAAETSEVFYGFPARPYLDKYYDTVGPENAALLHAIGDFVRNFHGPTESIIEVAGGPSMFALMAVVAERQLPFERVTFTDISPQNLDEVRWWLGGDQRRFDYTHLLSWLQRERGASPRDVEQWLRSSAWQVQQRDWLLSEDPSLHGSYDVVASHFFTESATSDEAEFLAMLRKVRRLGRPGSLMLLSFMTHSSGYRIAGQDFPAFGLDRKNLGEYLHAAGIELSASEMRFEPTEVSPEESGYDGLIFLGGRLTGD